MAEENTEETAKDRYFRIYGSKAPAAKAPAAKGKKQANPLATVDRDVARFKQEKKEQTAAWIKWFLGELASPVAKGTFRTMRPDLKKIRTQQSVARMIESRRKRQGELAREREKYADKRVRQSLDMEANENLTYFKNHSRIVELLIAELEAKGKLSGERASILKEGIKAKISAAKEELGIFELTEAEKGLVKDAAAEIQQNPNTLNQLAYYADPDSRSALEYSPTDSYQMDLRKKNQELLSGYYINRGQAKGGNKFQKMMSYGMKDDDKAKLNALVDLYAKELSNTDAFTDTPGGGVLLTTGLVGEFLSDLGEQTGLSLAGTYAGAIEASMHEEAVREVEGKRRIEGGTDFGEKTYMKLIKDTVKAGGLWGGDVESLFRKFTADESPIGGKDTGPGQGMPLTIEKRLEKLDEISGLSREHPKLGVGQNINEEYDRISAEIDMLENKLHTPRGMALKRKIMAGSKFQGWKTEQGFPEGGDDAAFRAYVRRRKDDLIRARRKSENLEHQLDPETPPQDMETPGIKPKDAPPQASLTSGSQAEDLSPEESLVATVRKNATKKVEDHMAKEPATPFKSSLGKGRSGYTTSAPVA